MKPTPDRFDVKTKDLLKHQALKSNTITDYLFFYL